RRYHLQGAAGNARVPRLVRFSAGVDRAVGDGPSAAEVAREATEAAAKPASGAGAKPASAESAPRRFVANSHRQQLRVPFGVEAVESGLQQRDLLAGEELLDRIFRRLDRVPHGRDLSLDPLPLGLAQLVNTDSHPRLGWQLQQRG